MTIYEAISLMFLFTGLMINLLAFVIILIEHYNKKK